MKMTRYSTVKTAPKAISLERPATGPVPQQIDAPPMVPWYRAAQTTITSPTLSLQTFVSVGPSLDQQAHTRRTPNPPNFGFGITLTSSYAYIWRLAGSWVKPSGGHPSSACQSGVEPTTRPQRLTDRWYGIDNIDRHAAYHSRWTYNHLLYATYILH